MNLDAIIFVPALAGSVIFGFVFALFAAHHYLTAVQSTGSGARDVVWVSEPIVDHFWKLFYLAWLIGLWLGPAYLLGRLWTAGTDSAWVRLAVPLAVFWVCYPVSQLSSLGGPTIWLPLDPGVLGRLARKPGVVFGFYAVSAVVLAVFGVAFRWVFLTAGQYELLLVGIPLLVISGLVYGRLIGRLAFALRFTRPLFTRKKRKPPREEESPPAAASTTAPMVQPSDLPPIASADGPLTGYDLSADDEPPRPKKRVRAEAVADEPRPQPRPQQKKRPTPKPGLDRARTWTDEDDDDTPYGAGLPEVEPEAVAPKEVVKPSEAELRLHSREGAPKPPKTVWTPELLTFLGRPDTWSVVLTLSVMCLGVGVMIRIARAFNPVAGG
jgi:hypothetical protein